MMTFYSSEGDVLFDFTDPSTSLESWTESSDTVREVGMSKASFVIQQTQRYVNLKNSLTTCQMSSKYFFLFRYRRAIFFALLNPQPNGACFAGFRTHSVEFDPSKYQAVQVSWHQQLQSTGNNFKNTAQGFLVLFCKSSPF